MALKNNHLINARKTKKNEFYTLYSDIESEMMKFKNEFKDKIVYCPCDNEKSEFRRFFIEKYSEFNLSGFYASALDGNTIYYDGKNIIELDKEGVDITKPKFIGLLDKCDLVVTNPPFSDFVVFINTIIQHNKEFLIVGQQNTITCKSIFENIMNDKIHLDYGFSGIAGWFKTPKEYDDYAVAGEHKEGLIRVSGVIWYTSFVFEENRPFINLKCSYYNEDGTVNSEKYKTFDNFRKISGLDCDCINVGKVKDIPNDYYGYMGVPISFFGKYNPKQFELIQLDHYGPLGNQDNIVDGKMTYRRIYVRLRKTI